MFKQKQTKQCAQCDAFEPQYVIGSNIIKIIKECKHSFCTNCFKSLLTNITQSKKPQSTYCCPIQNCKQQIDLKEILKYLSLPNTCKKCNKETPYTCGQCFVKDIEEIAKINFFSKLLKLEELVEWESQKALSENIQQNQLICPVCKEFNQMPVIVCLLGHEICKDCYHNIRKIDDIQQVCPLCKTELLPTPPNSLRAQNKIKSLIITCQSCQQPVQYQEFVQTHFRQCIMYFMQGCSEKIKCIDCGDNVEALFQDIHRANYCLGSACPFNCDRKLEDHQYNFIMEHLLSIMRQSDVAHSFLIRMQVVERFLFHGSFGICPSCEYSFAWYVDVRGIQSSFCFQCFRITG